MTRPIRLAATWFAAIALATGVAYFGVTAALQGDREPSHARQQLEDARRISQYAADLRALLDQIAGPRTGPAPRLPAPMLDELRAKVRQSQQEILRAHLNGSTYDALLTAADRLSACAAAQQNESLRSAALRAQDDLETLIANEIKRLKASINKERSS